MTNSKKPQATPGGEPKDPEQMEINEEWELKHWADEMGLKDEDQMKDAVKEVGVLTTKKRRYEPPH